MVHRCIRSRDHDLDDDRGLRLAEDLAATGDPRVAQARATDPVDPYVVYSPIDRPQDDGLHFLEALSIQLAFKHTVLHG